MSLPTDESGSLISTAVPTVRSVAVIASALNCDGVVTSVGWHHAAISSCSAVMPGFDPNVTEMLPAVVSEPVTAATSYSPVCPSTARICDQQTLLSPTVIDRVPLSLPVAVFV